SLLGNEVRDNVAPHQGGGIYVFDSAVYCSANVVTNCRAIDGGGGGLYLQEVPAGARFVDNVWRRCSGPLGGGALVKDETFAVFQRDTFSDCHAESNGGGMAVFLYSDVTLTDCSFLECSAVDGGGLWARDSDVRMMGSSASMDQATFVFDSCSASSDGGGFYLEEIAVAVASGIRITDCSSVTWGGGAYVLHTPATFTRNLVAGCSSGQGGGVALHTENRALHTTSTVLNNTVFGCGATDGVSPGGGFTLAAARDDNIANFAGNLVVGTLQGSGIRCLRGGSQTGTGSPRINCSTIYNDSSNPTDHVFGARCEDSMSSDSSNQDGVDPLLCNPGAGDFRLASNSPAVASSCLQAGGKVDRGAHLDGDHCSGRIVSLTPESWSRIKARYR
ncbi:MAG TPA: right-handed parallel beta-helix repeat-containing protein, partial [bacterium]|nr:right-handed parallel beta-helix repeat-containing protein [bacterium]